MPRVWMPGGVATELQLVGEDTGGAFCLMIDEPPAGWSLAAHRHATEAETIHILAGEFMMDVDGRRVALSPGETIHIPQGVPHAGANAGPAAGRRLVLFSPAGIERFFLEVGQPSPDDEPDLAAVIECATRYGWRFLGGS